MPLNSRLTAVSGAGRSCKSTVASADTAAVQMEEEILL
jgi:hypothetical protein